MNRIAPVLVFVMLAVSVQASRIKDLVLIEGARDNQLIGYGLVVGLAGSGDSEQEMTLRSVSNSLKRFGINVDPSEIESENAAAVLITADIGPDVNVGSRIDIMVSSIGDAESLQGGILLQTPMVGADDVVYAVAQGPLAVGGFLGGEGGPGGSTVQKNHPTVGRIVNGAIVERKIPNDTYQRPAMRLILHNPDFVTAVRIADRINEAFPEVAQAVDPSTISVMIPAAFRGQQVNFIAGIGAFEVQPDTPARVVFNERTGTIVATENVRLSRVAISHGSLTITIASNLEASQPAPFSENGDTVVLPSTQTTVRTEKGGFRVVEEQPTIKDLSDALNALGTTTRDMMSILQALKTAGALQAELIIN